MIGYFLKNKITIFIWVLLFIAGLQSCVSTKRVSDNQLLLKKNNVTITGDEKAKTDLNPYIIQRPNTKFIGIPFLPIQLFAYNLANPEFEKKFQNRLLKYQDSSHFWTNTLSLKQTVGYANFIKNINIWLMENGEAPTILDTTKTNKTIETLQLYYINQGYFKAKTSYSIDTIAHKKAQVNYQIITDKPFYLNNIQVDIASPVLDSLYNANQSKSVIKSGQIFQRDKFEKEAERLTNIYRNAGVYHFSKYAINFRDIDSTSTDYKTNVLLQISDRLYEKNDSILEKPYQISYISRVNIYTDYQKNAQQPNDSITYNGIHLYALDDLNYKPRFLTRAIFIRPGERYSDTNLELTRKHLRSLQGYKSIKINYVENKENQLTANVYLSPVKKFGFKTEMEATHSNIKPFGLSGKLSFNNHNAFKGNEILQLSLQGSFLNSINFEGAFFNAWEVGGDVNLKIPRISLPFHVEKIIPQSMSPKTTISFGSSLQKNIGLDKQRFTGIVEYNWQATDKVNHSLEMINAQFIKNLNVSSYFNIYSSEYRKLNEIQQNYFPDVTLTQENALQFINQSLSDTNFEQNASEEYQVVQNVLYRHNIITENNFIPSINYTYTYNSQQGYTDQQYSYFRLRLSSAGLLPNLLLQNTESSTNKIFGNSIAQYVRMDFEYRRHWKLNYNSVLAMRTGLGVAIPYGNSDNVPFSRSYFAGGTNDIRAWKIYELGPGGTRSKLEFNVGNLKLLSSLEYRFDVFGSLKGALFVDAGNIWDITKSNLNIEKAKFNGLKSLENIAVGSGFGLRYDFSFLVFRTDIGFKTYEPYNVTSNRWFNSYNFNHANINIGINYPF